MPDSATSCYERFVLPCLLDCACSLPPITKQRRAVVPKAQGRVLEIGIGTGLNFPFYDRARVDSITGVDPSRQMHWLARRRSRKAGFDVRIDPIGAETLPFEPASFDTVLCTYTLCSVSDAAAVLAQVHRVLRPEGRLLFAEHGLAPDAAVVRWQRRLEPAWSRIAGGCHLTRDVPRLLAAAGFSARHEEAYVAWPRALAYNFWGEASKA